MDCHVNSFTHGYTQTAPRCCPYSAFLISHIDISKFFFIWKRGYSTWPQILRARIVKKLLNSSLLLLILWNVLRQLLSERVQPVADLRTKTIAFYHDKISRLNKAIINRHEPCRTLSQTYSFVTLVLLRRTIKPLYSLSPSSVGKKNHKKKRRAVYLLVDWSVGFHNETIIHPSENEFYSFFFTVLKN